MLEWVIPQSLARSSRPGYNCGRGQQVPAANVRDWIDAARKEQIRSIICLLADEHLALYRSLPVGLLDYYRQHGFQVTHVPAADHQRPSLTLDHLEAVWAAFQALPGPVLVHCSAGVDRTGAAVAHLLQHLQGQQQSKQRPDGF